MISEKDRTIILNIAKKYKAKKVILFGSGSLTSKECQDIDLAVEGIPNAQFFKFYSELIFNLSKPVDIVDLSRKSRFNNIVVSEGVLLYG
jgi:predicted nucleotidyltransferase